jgi:Xaa-Pro aminopeptidase
MKQEIDSLMQKHNIDALLIVGAAQHNPPMVYFTGGGHVTGADLIKKRGESGILFHASMERDEASKSGLETRTYDNYPIDELFKQAGGNYIDALASRYKKMFEDSGITKGKIALYGATDLGAKFAIFSRLQSIMPEIELTGFVQDPIIMTAMMTKDDQEISRIHRMGQITTAVVGKVAEFLTSQKVENEVLVDKDRMPITIGHIKSKINLWLAEAGAENPESTIFAIGRDAGVPHSQGTDQDLLSLGKTIVFDIFPCEIGGGYFYDFTRTWCLGYAPEPVQKIYQDVKNVYDTIVSELKINEPFKKYQTRTCQLFEAQGHPTIMQDPATQSGYVHSLGHGVGLNIHEMPFASSKAGDHEVLAKKSVFTIEPGLYYPDQGMGVRLEDTYFINDDGLAEKIVDYPMDLILTVKS